MGYLKTAIKEHFNIVEYISRYVSLKKSGRNYVGLCPFHQEKTPSFSVSEEKQIFHCFGCGVGGDLVNFLEKYLKISRYDVLVMLEKEKGIKLIQRDKDFEKKKKEVDIILSINKKALTIFFNNLFKTVEGGEALKYLRKRNVSMETIKRFYLGYGGKGWDTLAKELANQGFKEEDIKKTGLVYYSDTGKRDFFRNRLIFPIINQRGEVVGFGGRALDSSLPKYINSAENLVFSKRRNLYGINVAREKIIQEKRVYIVEGYLDCIAMHQAGYTNTVATLGTALTEEQIRFLKGLTEEFYLIYDGDEAGKKAAVRGVELFLNIGISPFIVTLPEREDPDSLLSGGRKKEFDDALSSAKKGVDFLIDLYKNKNLLQTSEDIRRFINSLGVHVRNIHNLLERELIVREISKVTGISYDKISQVMLSKEEINQGRKVEISRRMTPEEFILTFLLQKPEYNDYIDNDIRGLFTAEQEEVFKHAVLSPAQEDKLSESSRTLYSKLVVLDDGKLGMSEEAFFETLAHLKKKIIKEKKDRINELIKKEESTEKPDYEKIFMLQEEKKQLTMMENKIKIKGAKSIYEV